eukprot:CFRG8528T1
MGVRKSSAGGSNSKKDGPGGGGTKNKKYSSKPKTKPDTGKFKVTKSETVQHDKSNPIRGKKGNTKKDKKPSNHVDIPYVVDGNSSDENDSDNMEGLDDMDVRRASFLVNLDKKALTVRRNVVAEKEKESKEKADLEKIYAKVRAAQVAMGEMEDGEQLQRETKKRKATAANSDTGMTWKHEKKIRTFDSTNSIQAQSGTLPIKMADGRIRSNERLQIAREQAMKEVSNSEDESNGTDISDAYESGSEVDAGSNDDEFNVDEITEDEDETAAYVNAKDNISDSENDSDGSEGDTESGSEEEDEQDDDDIIFNPAVALMKAREDFNAIRVRIATLSQNIMEDTEENLSALSALLEIATDTQNDNRARKLALVSLMTVYNDVLPGYRIRLPTEAEKKQKVSKDVQALRLFEATLLSSYQKYLQFMQKVLEAYNRRVLKIRKMSKGNNGPGGDKGESKQLKMDALMDELKEIEMLVEVSVKCLGELLLARPSFNFGNNIIRSILPFGQEGPRKVPSIVCSYIRKLFESETDMVAVLEMTRGIAQIVKSQNYQARKELLETFGNLRLNVDLYDKTINPITNAKSAPIAKDAFGKEIHKSKKQRKKGKLEKELERELDTASAEQNRKELRLRYNEILKMVFLTYFRILKHGGASPLLSSTLKGLARFALLINVDFFTDLLKVFKRTLLLPNLPYEDGINCVATAFQICSGQGDVLILDLRDFFSHLYVLLLSLPTNTEHMLTMLNCFDYIKSQSHMLTLERIASFVKRLLTVALEIPSGSAIALLAYAYQLLLKSPRAQTMLDNDILGSGRFIPFATDPENSNATSCPLWELVALSNHAHPIVAIYAQELRKLGNEEVGTSARENNHHSMPPALRAPPIALYRMYDTSKGGFNPSIQQPKQHPLVKSAAKQGEDEVYLRIPDAKSVFESKA